MAGSALSSNKTEKCNTNNKLKAFPFKVKARIAFESKPPFSGCATTQAVVSVCRRKDKGNRGNLKTTKAKARRFLV